MRNSSPVPTPRPQPRVPGDARRLALRLCTLALLVLLGTYILMLAVWAKPDSPGSQLRLDQFLSMVQRGQVQNAAILAEDDRIVLEASGTRYWVDFSGDHESLFARLTSALETGNVPTTVRSQPIKRLVAPVGTIVAGLIVIDAIFILYLLSAGGKGSLSKFGQSSARQAAGGADGEPTLTFADVAGVDEAVVELGEVRDYLSSPDRFKVVGATAPKGVLLEGPPGCGKTRLARALAGEARAPFFTISGSDFVEMYVGVGAARIRDLFAQAKAQAPAIVFIDELDAVGRARTVTATGGQDEREAALNQLLVEMDGFESDSGVVVVAATNRADILDAALLRPGRFDRRIALGPPDLRGREAILAVHAHGRPLAPTADLGAVARRTVGFSGAELANVLNEASLLTARRRAEAIEQSDLIDAIERVVAGPERSNRILSAEDKRRIAVHEAGHAVCAAAVPGADRVGKVSIVARGHGGGFTWYVPAADRVLATRSQLLDRITALLGGRAAEQGVLGEPSTGANDDLRQAAGIARRMVWECGMSDRIGPLSISPSAGDVLDGTPPWSERILSELDREVQAIVRHIDQRAAAIVRANRAVILAMADRLVVDESLEGEALEALLGQVQPAETPEGPISTHTTDVEMGLPAAAGAARPTAARWPRLQATRAVASFSSCPNPFDSDPGGNDALRP